MSTFWQYDANGRRYTTRFAGMGLPGRGGIRPLGRSPAARLIAACPLGRRLRAAGRGSAGAPPAGTVPAVRVGMGRAGGVSRAVLAALAPGQLLLEPVELRRRAV